MSKITRNFIIILIMGVFMAFIGFGNYNSITERVYTGDDYADYLERGWSEKKPEATDQEKSEARWSMFLGIAGIVVCIIGVVYKVTTKADKENISPEEMERYNKIKKIVIFIIVAVFIIAVVVSNIKNRKTRKTIEDGYSLWNKTHLELNSTNDTENSTTNSVQDVDVDTFNKQFNGFEGAINGIDVNFLPKKVIESNRTYSKHKITIEYFGKIYSTEEELNEGMGNTSNMYNSTFEYDSDGYINKIIIGY